MSTIDKPIPVDKICKSCGQRKLLSDYDFSNSKKNKRLAICKSCIEIEQEEVDDAPNGCCLCFVEMTTHNSFIQLDSF